MIVYTTAYIDNERDSYHWGEIRLETDANDLPVLYQDRAGAQAECDRMNVTEVEGFNRRAKRRHDDRVLEYRKAKALFDAGLSTYEPTEPEPFTEVTLEDLQAMEHKGGTWFVQEIEVQ